jgi:hypothetical protein
MGIEKMKKHWRNLVARYGALPVVWCLAGEATMPYYLSENKEADTAFQKKGWTELAAYVRQIDPWHNLITIHPTHKGRDQVEDPALLDFEMLQTWHGDRQALAPTVNSIVASRACQPIMPVLDGEVCYEGLGEACRQEVQRYLFWAAMLSGACGHTYGANGIWQVNTREKPYGPSPHGMAWGDTPWEEAFMLPGSSQLGIGKRILERFAWWRFEPHPEWVEPHWTTENYFAGYAAGIPGEARIIYLPAFPGGRTVVKWLEQDVKYRAALINPVNGRETALGNVMADAAGDWTIQEETKGALHFSFPLFQDWLVILERV